MDFQQFRPLLVDAGTYLKAADLDGNTAISLIASSGTMDEIPTKEVSPGIFKVFVVFYLVKIEVFNWHVYL